MLLSVWVFHGCEDLEHNVIGTRRKQGLYLSFQFFPLPLRSMFNRNGLGISGNLLLTYHHLPYHINRHDQDFLSTSHRLLRCYGNRICLHGNLPRALPRWVWLFFPIITRHEMKVHKIVTHPFPRQKRSRPPVILLL